MPLLAALIAVGGFLFGIYQFQAQQRALQDRALLEQKRSDATAELAQKRELQDRIRTDVDTLLQFFSDGHQTVSAAAFGLDELKANLKIKVELASGVPRGSVTQREITENLVGSVEDDCDLSRSRDAAFVVALIDRWPDYNTYLGEKQVKIRFMLDRYEGAVWLMANRESRAFAGLRYDPVANQY